MNSGSATIDDESAYKRNLRMLQNEDRNRQQLANRLTAAHGLDYRSLLREDFDKAVNKGEFHKGILTKTLDESDRIRDAIIDGTYCENSSEERQNE